jgi:hypothetical protein
MYLIKQYVIKFVSNLRQVGDFLRPRYNWNIVESSVIHQNPYIYGSKMSQVYT